MLNRSVFIRGILCCAVIVIFFASCKKDHPVSAQPATSSSEGFRFYAFDENYNVIPSLNGNSFIINFYQNGIVVHSKKLSGNLYYGFAIDNFTLGNYLVEVTDSLGQFGYLRDSLITNPSGWKLKGGQLYSWVAYPSITLGSIIKKPNFSILDYTMRDTTMGTILSVTTGNVSSVQYLAIYFYKNNKASYLNAYNYAPLYPSSPAHQVSPTHTTITDIFFDFVLMDGTGLHSGDSVYFAVYPASIGFYNQSDNAAPLDTLHYPQYTAVGSQRVLIPYKLH